MVKKTNLVEDEKNWLIADMLRIPVKNYFHDKKASLEMVEAFMKLGFEMSLYYRKKTDDFSAISINNDFDRYCASISGSTIEEALANCIHYRLKNGPHGSVFS